MASDLTSARLQREIEDLRGLVANLRAQLNAGRRVTMRAIERHRFLGQPATLVATVTEPGNVGSPSVVRRPPSTGIPVTFVTSWGHLSPGSHSAPGRGTTITVRATASGTASVKLWPPVSQDLLAPQQDALQQTLDLLDTTIATPRDLELGLTWLAQLYRWETQVDLRRAIDVYVRDLSQDRLDPINERDELDAWSYVDVLVTAYVPDETGGTIESAAALPIRFKDWLGPWLQTYRQLAADAHRLPENFDWLASGLDRSTQVTDRIYERVRAHVAEQPGLIGEQTGRAVAERAIHAFLHGEAGDVSPAVKAGLFPALGDAGSVVSSGGGAVLDAVSGVRADIRQDVAGKANTSDLRQLAQTVDGKLADKVDLGVFDQFQTSVTGSLRTKLSIADAERNLATKAELDTRLADKVDASVFADFRTEIAASVETKLDIDDAGRTLATRVEVDAGLATKVEQTEFDSRLAEKADQSMLASKIDSDTFEQRLAVRLDAALATLVDRDAFDAFRAELTRSLEERVTNQAFEAAIRDTREGVNADLAEFRRILDGKVDEAIFERELATKVDTATLDQRLATKVDETTFNTELAGKVDRQTFQTELGQKVDRATFDRTITGVNRQVSGLNIRIDNFNR